MSDDIKTLVQSSLGAQESVQQTAVARQEGAAISASPVDYVELTEEQRQLIRTPIDDNDVRIRPDGIVYISHVTYRRMLNKIFGELGWVVNVTNRQTLAGRKVVVHGELFVAGKLVLTGLLAEADYFENSPTASLVMSSESAESRLVRAAAKRLGLWVDIWDTPYIEEWRDKNAVYVLAEGSDRKTGEVKTKNFWRRRDAKPIRMTTGGVAYRETKVIFPSPQQQSNARR